MSTIEATAISIPELHFDKRQTIILGVAELAVFTSLEAEGLIGDSMDPIQSAREEVVRLFVTEGPGSFGSSAGLLKYADVFYADVIKDLWKDGPNFRSAIEAITHEVDLTAVSMLRRSVTETIVVPTNMAIENAFSRLLYDSAADDFKEEDEKPRVGAVKATLLGSIAFLASNTTTSRAAGV